MILSISTKTFEGVEIARLKGEGDVSENQMMSKFHRQLHTT
jgi:hypothetical protein